MNALLRNPWPRALLATGFTLLATACTTVGPDYIRPAFDSPAHYKEAASGANLDTYFTAVHDKWWEIYHDPVLNALVEQVSVNNQSLAAAEARVHQAERLVQVASGARLPTLSAGSFRSGRKNDLDFGLVISWELDLWGRIRRDVEAHQASAEASANDLAAATLSMQAQVVQSYFAIREADSQIALLQRALDVNEQWSRMVRNQYAQGLSSSSDVGTALTQFGAMKMQLANIKTSRAQFEHALAVMTGKAPADFNLVAAPFNIEVPDIPSGLPAMLLYRRPDIAASERRMAAASARIGVSKAETLPSVNLAAGIGVLKGPRASVDVNAPLFTGGRLDAQVDQAWAAYAESVANYRQTALDAFREVEDNLVAATNLADTANIEAIAADAAQKSEQDTRNQYRQGIVEFDTLVQVSSTSLNAQQAELQLRLQRLNTSVNLAKALGGGWRSENAAVKKDDMVQDTPSQDVQPSNISADKSVTAQNRTQ